MRTRINISFDEWTDRSKRAWVAVNLTYCDATGKMVKRLATVVSIVAPRPVPKAASGSSSSSSSSSS